MLKIGKIPREVVNIQVVEPNWNLEPLEIPLSSKISPSFAPIAMIHSGPSDIFQAVYFAPIGTVLRIYMQALCIATLKEGQQK